MFEIAAIIYLWLIGAWGHWDLHQQTPHWLSQDLKGLKTERRIAIVTCLLWPLLCPVVMLMDAIDHLKGKLHGPH